jgi:hypothetical protein
VGGKTGKRAGDEEENKEGKAIVPVVRIYSKI